MKFESIMEWQKATLEKAAADERTDTTDLLINLLVEWAADDYFDYIAEKAEEYNFILEEQE